MADSSALHNTTILIVEANSALEEPYSYVSEARVIHRVASTEKALKDLLEIAPDLVFLSASFAPVKALKLLEALKNASKTHLIPLVVVVDLSHRISTILGTTWGGRVAVVDSAISSPELSSTLTRVLQG